MGKDNIVHFKDEIKEYDIESMNLEIASLELEVVKIIEKYEKSLRPSGEHPCPMSSYLVVASFVNRVNSLAYSMYEGFLKDIEKDENFDLEAKKDIKRVYQDSLNMYFWNQLKKITYQHARHINFLESEFKLNRDLLNLIKEYELEREYD